MILFLFLLFLLVNTFYFYLQHPKFGAKPSGARLERIKKSPAFSGGKFHNQQMTPQLTEGTSLWKVLFEFLFSKKPRRKPEQPIPSQKTDLLQLTPDENVLIWFGHSSYFIQLDGKKFLVDPVFSGNASPFPGSNKAFDGTDRYTIADLPEIDVLFISHDHYDHVDYLTLKEAKSKIKKVICGLGVGAHLERWGYKPKNIIEKDWYESFEMETGFLVHTTPARHFSGRSFSRNNTLWMSFVLQTPSMKLYLGGDSGYDPHFAETGNAHGPFDLAILENGQYDPKWKYIHLLPDEVIPASIDLKAKRVFPVHSSKFVMANHPWDEPLQLVHRYGIEHGVSVITPMIGEKVNLNDIHQTFSKWWKDVK